MAKGSCLEKGKEIMSESPAPAPAAEPALTEPAPTEPAPTEPTPTEPAPVQPAPTEPAPTELAPTEPAPAEPAPAETTPAESTATGTETAATGTASTEKGATETVQSETTPSADSGTASKPAATVAVDAASTPIQELWSLAQANGHPEVWGVTLADPESHVPTQIVLQKYLNANDGDLAKAKDQLTKTLEWRAKMKPLELLQKQFNRSKFEALGYVTSYPADADAAASKPESREVFTWNIYGGVKSIDDTFGDLDA